MFPNITYWALKLIGLTEDSHSRAVEERISPIHFPISDFMLLFFSRS